MPFLLKYNCARFNAVHFTLGAIAYFSFLMLRFNFGL